MVRKPKRRELNRRAPSARRQVILEAGLAAFSVDGFAATKMDDVAAKAGVAKGTVYLYFKDKQDLFEQIVREAVAPVIARIEGMALLPGAPTELVLKSLFEIFRIEVLGTHRKDALRLVLTEGPKFPSIAEFYHREVVSRGLRLIRELLQRAKAKGELSTDALADFPQLVFAPLIMAVIWDGLFADIEPLDVEKMFDAHRRALLVGPGHGKSS